MPYLHNLLSTFAYSPIDHLSSIFGSWYVLLCSLPNVWVCGIFDGNGVFMFSLYHLFCQCLSPSRCWLLPSYRMFIAHVNCTDKGYIFDTFNSSSVELMPLNLIECRNLEMMNIAQILVQKFKMCCDASNQRVQLY